ncbi:MAG: EamA family transporter [Rhizobiaceae bacterium]|nr:EamA family transporter [Rhizobiaceae bacterium]
MPLFFSSNIIFGRVVADQVEPFILAFIRWSLTALILLPFVWPTLVRQRQLIVSQWRQIALLGFLGMWICGALVYLALDYTTATNGTLIYTSSPVLIILIEWLFGGRKISTREALGIAIAVFGVVVLVVKGSLDTLMSLSLNLGDLIFIGAAFSWAIYSVLLKARSVAPLQTLPLFMLIAATGALLLAPFTLVEIAWRQTFPTSLSAWTNIAGIVLLASLLAFSFFQYGVKVLGPSVTGIFMYLLPVYGVGLAVLFLGEELALYHMWGVLLVLSGLVLATWPKKVFREIRSA